MLNKLSNREGFRLRNGSQREGFSLIELIVVIAIVGILVILAMPKFLGYVEKSELARIKHDVKIMEDKMSEKMISNNREYLSWDNNIKELGMLVMADMLFETKGLARGVVKPKTKRYGDTTSDAMLLGEEEVEHKDYKIVPDAVVKEIKSKLPGTFYSNIDGKVYYEHGKPLTNAKEDIVLGCEAPEPLNYDFDETTGTILKYNGKLQHLVIPSSFKIGELCYPVRIIGKGAFMRGSYNGVEQKPIKTIVIPSSVEKIEEDALKDNDIENVIIPPSVTNIGNNAFAGNNLGNNGDGESSGVVIQGRLDEVSIGNFAFGRGPLGNLVAPTYRPSTDKDLDINISTTTNEKGEKVGTIIKYGGDDTSVVIPAIIIVDDEEVKVEKIDKGAYQGKGLISVKLPNGLKELEDYAFAGNQLIEISTPETVNHIGNYVFAFNEVTGRNSIRPTIRSIKILSKNPTIEYLGNLGKLGDIEIDGNKVNKLGITELQNFIFVTSNDNVLIKIDNINDIPSIYDANIEGSSNIEEIKYSTRDTIVFNYTNNNKLTWVVAISGTYEVDVYGAGGRGNGGKGARVKGETYLKKGDKLTFKIHSSGNGGGAGASSRRAQSTGSGTWINYTGYAGSDGSAGTIMELNGEIMIAAGGAGGDGGASGPSIKAGKGGNGGLALIEGSDGNNGSGYFRNGYPGYGGKSPSKGGDAGRTSGSAMSSYLTGYYGKDGLTKYDGGGGGGGGASYWGQERTWAAGSGGGGAGGTSFVHETLNNYQIIDGDNSDNGMVRVKLIKR